MKSCVHITKWAVSVALGLGLASHLAFAQDPVKVAPDIYKVRQDNDQARVLEIQLKPGQKVPMHSHPDYIIYNFSPCKIRFTAPDGKTTDFDLQGGETVFRSAETHAVENIGETGCHVLNIEVKQPARAMVRQPVDLTPEAMQWKDAPPAFPRGAQMAVLSGDPQKPGPFTIRLKAPAGYKVPPHWHPEDELVTVISGAIYLGMGDEFDESKGKAHSPGSFAAMPAGMHHFAWTRGETIIQINGIGPWGITYFNPADDPRLAPTGRSGKNQQ